MHRRVSHGSVGILEVHQRVSHESVGIREVHRRVGDFSEPAAIIETLAASTFQPQVALVLVCLIATTSDGTDYSQTLRSARVPQILWTLTTLLLANPTKFKPKMLRSRGWLAELGP